MSSEEEVKQMKVQTFTPQELKDALTERGLPTAGLKADLQERLIEAIRGEGGAPQEEEGKPDEGGEEEPPGGKRARDDEEEKPEEPETKRHAGGDEAPHHSAPDVAAALAAAQAVADQALAHHSEPSAPGALTDGPHGCKYAEVKENPGGYPSFFLDIYIPDNMVGRLIGKKGSNLQRLRAESGAEVKVDHENKGGPLRRVTLSANSRPQVELARDKAFGLVAPNEGEGEERGPELEDTVQVPGTMVAKVIGAKGMVIKALQAICRCRIKVNQDGQQPGTDTPRDVLLGGPQDAIEAAKAWIAELVAKEGEDYKTLMGQILDQANNLYRVVIDIPSQMVGKVKGHGGATIRALLEASGGCKIEFEQDASPTARVIVRGMHQGKVKDTEESIRDLTLGSGVGLPLLRGGPGGPQGGGGRGGGPYGGQGYGGYGQQPPPPHAYGGGGYPGYGFPPYGYAAAPYGGYGGYPQAAAGGYGGYPQAGYGQPAAAPGGAPSGSGLPAGWTEQRDDQGRVYFYNTASGVSQWERPTA